MQDDMRHYLLGVLKDNFSDNEYKCGLVADYKPYKLKDTRCIAIVGHDTLKITAALIEWLQEIESSDRDRLWEALDFIRQFLAGAKAGNQSGWAVVYNEDYRLTAA
jgi:hypothetical protein